MTMGPWFLSLSMDKLNSQWSVFDGYGSLFRLRVNDVSLEEAPSRQNSEWSKV